MPARRFLGLFGTALCTGTDLINGTLDSAFDDMVADFRVSCCMPEFTFCWPYA